MTEMTMEAEKIPTPTPTPKNVKRKRNQKWTRFSDILEEFQLSQKKTYIFGSSLTATEIGTVHNICRELGMYPKTHKTRTDDLRKHRSVMVFKDKTMFENFGSSKKVPVKTMEKLRSFIFSEESKAALHDLFSQHPPNDADMDENKVVESSGKNLKVRANREETFRKPVMTQSEIAYKLASLSSRIEQSPRLRQITEKRSKLPIASFKDVITSTIESHQVILICGETGCGKTTQVPQFLLDHSWSKGETCKVVCSQPRRISASSVAERIASERGEALGDSVGYKVRLDGKGGRNSSLMFCTNGILLRVLVGNTSDRNKMSSKKTANCDFGITHIIVDEIHERDRFSDIMLTILRDMLPLYPHLRLILMSATIDAEQFSMYFGGCPIIRVPGFTYPVKSFYLEDVLSLVRSTENSKPKHTKGDVTMEDTFITDGFPTALDKAIDLALSNDDFDPLLELISSEGTVEVFNYQHSKTGETPLMVFAGKGRVSDICMLLSLGVDCRLQSHAGKTAFDYAIQCNQIEAAKFIKMRMGKASTMNSNEDKKLLDEDTKLFDEDKKLLDDDKKLSDEEDKKLLDEYLLNVNPELIDYVLIEQLLRKICMDSEDGAILVFLPGWDEINRTRDNLLASPFFKDPSKFIVIPLHSKVPLEQQNKAFIRPMRGCRKIILSTNIAETSVTIEDVVYVLDSGRMKEKNYDPYYNISTLQSSWISKANAKQREGRAGRCQPGICYHLFSKLRWASLPDFQVPEIKRMPIEELCLQVKLIDPSSKIEEFMQKTLDPPVQHTITNALVVLQNVGALTPDEKLTELGEKLGTLPVHPLTSKMLFLAILMNCLDPALTLACAANNRSPFINPMHPDEKNRAQAAKLELASLYGGNGDQLALIAALDCWRIAKEKGEANKFCTRYFVLPNSMRMLSLSRKKLKAELQRLGFLPEDTSRCSLNAKNPGILHAVIFAGLYPMVGKMIPVGGRSLVQTIGLKRVRLHSSSTNAKLSVKKFKVPPLIIFDEITRGDGGMSIRECCLIGLLPLLLLAAEIVVAPTSENEIVVAPTSENEIVVAPTSENDNDNSEKIIASPKNVVKVVVDRWLPLESTALDVAQIYCLRERLAAAILFKVKHPHKVLPKPLGDSLYAITCIISNDGMSGISLPHQNEPIESLGTNVSATEPVGSLATNVSATEPVGSLATNVSATEPVDSLATNVSATKSVDSLATNVSATEPADSLATNVSATEPADSLATNVSATEPVDLLATNVSATEPVDSLATVVSATNIGQTDHCKEIAATQLPQTDLNSLMHNQSNSLESHMQPPVSDVNVKKSAAKKQKSSKKRGRLGPVDSLSTVVSATHVMSIAVTQLPQNDLNSLMHIQSNSLESQAQPPVSEINVNKSAVKQKSSKKRPRLEPVDSLAAIVSATDIGQAVHGKAISVIQVPQNDLNSLMHNQNNSLEPHPQPPVSEINVNKSAAKQNSSKKRQRRGPDDSLATMGSATEPVDSLATIASASEPVASLTTIVSGTDIGQADPGKAVAVTQVPQNDLNLLMHNQNNSLESHAQPPVSEIKVNKSAVKQKLQQRGPADSLATIVSASEHVDSLATIACASEPVDSLATVVNAIAVTQVPQNDLNSLMHSQNNSLEYAVQPPIFEINVNNSAAKQEVL